MEQALNKNLKNLQILLGAMSEDHLGKTDFIAQFEKIIAFVKQIAEKNIAEMEMMKQMIHSMAEQMKNGNMDDMAMMKEKMMSYCQIEMVKMQKECDTIMAEHEMKIREMDSKMSEIHNGKDADEQMMIDTVIEKAQKPIIEKVENELPQLGEKIRDGLEILQGEERLDSSAIKGLKEQIEELKTTIANIPKGGMKGMRKVPIVKRYRLTDQCNGITKSFTLPADTVDILGIWGTEFPITFDTADWSFSGRTLTLGTNISAPASGQTLMCLIETLFY